MRVSVDAMGGDFAPREIVLGALDAAKTINGLKLLYLVGDENAIKSELKLHTKKIPECIKIIHTTEVVEMGEAPATAIRRKKDSSISKAIDLVKNGDADAVFSAGNTGAAVAAATLKLRTLNGVDRPAIATVIPTSKDPYVLLDAGATPDSSPEMLQQYAVMGSIYSREILGVTSPRVGLLSIGEEVAKGNEVTKKSFNLLESIPVNFVGNVESRDLFSGAVDVAVCDGFVGNVVLKTTEAVAKMIASWLKDLFRKTPLRAIVGLLSKGVFNDMRAKGDPSHYGGAPLLGANGIVIIGHGSSNSFAAFNGIRVASEAISHDLNHLIEEELQSIK